MPKEETIELRHVRGVVGEKEDLPRLNALSSLSSRTRSLLYKTGSVPQLIHLLGAIESDSTVTFDAGEDYVNVLYSDGVYLYVGLDTNPGMIVKVDLSTFVKVSTLTLDSGEDLVYGLLSDGTYLYATLGTAPGKVVKINLASFTKESTLTLDAGDSLLYNAASDGTFLYCSQFATPPKVTKINLATFTKDSSLTIGDDLEFAYTMYFDGSYIYTGILDLLDVGRLVKIDKSTFTVTSSLSLDAGEGAPYIVYSDGSYLYVGLSAAPPRVLKIDLSTYTRVSSLTLDAAGSVRSLESDGLYLYAGLNTSPAKIVKIDLATYTVVSTHTLAAGENVANYARYDGTSLYVGLGTNPGKVVRMYIMPSLSFHQKKIDLLYDQIHSGTYSVYPALAAGVTLTSNAAAWTKGAYAQVVPASTIATTFYITHVILYDMTLDTEYEVDIATGAAASESVIGTVFHKNTLTAGAFDANTVSPAHECEFPVPIKVSSNTRISARCADSTGGRTCKVKIRYKT